jgi:hypothetical protein
MTSDGSHDQLGQRLRIDADASSAGFSESLHRRVMDALATEKSSPMAVPHPAWRRGWPMAAAAAVILAAGLAAYFGGRRPAEVPPVQVVQWMQMPTPGELVSQTAMPLLQGLDDLHSRTYAAANTDARNLARFMARQLDLAAPAIPVQ